MGVDLYISGHAHEQKVYYGDVDPSLNMGDTPWVITGGVGGVTSEEIPTQNGDDDTYGYMDIEMSLHNLLIKAYSHGGTQGATIIRNMTKTTPVHQNHELLLAGCTQATLQERRPIRKSWSEPTWLCFPDPQYKLGFLPCLFIVRVSGPFADLCGRVVQH